MNEIPPHLTDTSPCSGELSRLVTAAVVNQEFCNLLLTNPKLALAAGYKGEVFRLTPEEYRLILSIRATSLADFARQLAKRRNGNSNRAGHNGYGNDMLRKPVNSSNQ